MMQQKILKETLRAEIFRELFSNILPYWCENTEDKEFGGFVGRIDGRGNLLPHSEKGAILNARILWTFAHAYRLYGYDRYLNIAAAAKDYILGHFLDKEMGGVFWSVDYQGRVSSDKKQVYALAFLIYGLSEYSLATHDSSALQVSANLFDCIEKYAWEPEYEGYIEARSRQWNNLDDLRLSEQDMNVCKTMNTHLHVLEAYTNLYRALPSVRLEKCIRTLIHLFFDKIINVEGTHLGLFFDNEWNHCSQVISFGHDIEFSWLVTEAAEVLHDPSLIEKVKSLVRPIVDSVVAGLNEDGGLRYEYNLVSGDFNRDCLWWVQAEAVLGFYHAYQLYGDEKYLQLSAAVWKFIQQNIIDYEHGEWFWSSRNRQPDLDGDKVGFWKCPYHNGRMCMNMTEWISRSGNNERNEGNL